MIGCNSALVRVNLSATGRTASKKIKKRHAFAQRFYYFEEVLLIVCKVHQVHQDERRCGSGQLGVANNQLKAPTEASVFYFAFHSLLLTSLSA